MYIRGNASNRRDRSSLKMTMILKLLPLQPGKSHARHSALLFSFTESKEKLLLVPRPVPTRRSCYCCKINISQTAFTAVCQGFTRFSPAKSVEFCGLCGVRIFFFLSFFFIPWLLIMIMIMIDKAIARLPAATCLVRNKRGRK